MSHSLLGKLKRLAGELGPVGVLAYGLHLLGGRSGGLLGLSRYLFVAQPVAGQPLLPARRGRSIAVRRLDPQAPELLALPLDRAVLAYRAGQGAVCFGAFKEDRIIGCLWLCLGAYEEDEVRCRYRPLPAGRASWDFDVYLLPEQRSGLGFARLWDEANAFLRAQGVTYSWSRISAFNTESLAAHSRLGARVMGQATFLWLGPCQIMLGSVPPYRHLSFRRKAGPTLELHNP
ncbi:MAG: GNAT family N-acetyltransferase [Kiloniellaceae bacterium]